MARSPMSALLIASLLAFAVCGAGLMCLELLTHYSVLAGSIPLQAFTFSALSFALMAAVVALYTYAPDVFRIQSRLFGRSPGTTIAPPLLVAFSDGILNPKVF